MPSFILIHPTVWPQYTNAKDQQDMTNRTGRQRTDSTGRTVLQTVAQKVTENPLHPALQNPEHLHSPGCCLCARTAVTAMGVKQNEKHMSLKTMWNEF